MKKISIAGLFLLSACLIQAQALTGGDSDAVKHFLKKIHSAYDQAQQLSFRVAYRYANKSQPGKFLDTLSGEIAMDKNRIHFAIAGTKTLVNAKYSIKIIEDEQLIYLSKPQREGILDPVHFLDTLLVHAGGGHAIVTSGKQYTTMEIKFPDGKLYKNITMTIDENSGLFQKVVYDLYTQDLVGNDQVSMPGHEAPYESEGRVEVIFSNYQKGKLNESLFDEAQYFKRKGNHIEPSDRYNGYRVFVASPNL